MINDLLDRSVIATMNMLDRPPPLDRRNRYFGRAAARSTIVVPMILAGRRTRLLRVDIDADHQTIAPRLIPAREEVPQRHAGPTGYALRVLRRPTIAGPTHLVTAGG